MTTDEKIKILQNAYDICLRDGRVKSKAEFAELVGTSRTSMSSAFGGDEKYLTDRLITRIQAVIDLQESPAAYPESVLLLPWEAKGGLIGDFADAVQEYQCERIISPIRGADFAMQVAGDSMSPEYPSGSVVLIKKINEEAFVEWGKVYVLDTPNGAVIKQIRRTPDPHVVECVSINPGYQPFTLDCKYINGWYRVMMVMSIK